MLKAFEIQVKYLASPESAIFVLNKWDMVDEKAKLEQLGIVTKCLEERWPMIRPYQVLPLNSKQAEIFLYYAGTSTPDLEEVFKSITKILPGSLNNIIMKSLRYVK